jgi:serine/threonine protein kinase
MNDLTCPTREELARFDAGTLPEEESVRIGGHLDECGPCRTVIAAMNGKPGDSLSSALRRRAPWDKFADELELRRAISVIQAFGRDGAFCARPADVGVAEDALGQYKLLARLGQGGRGTVYLALHTQLRKLVALKVLSPGRSQNADALAGFNRELQALGQLNHRHIVSARDAGEAGGARYLVMELVAGADLSKLSRRLGALDIADACELIRQAALGLEYAHRRGIVHGNIKPSKLMLASMGAGGALVKILGLGLALWEDGPQQAPSDLTDPGQIVDTSEFLAPEQALNSHTVDPRADIYALGATLSRLLTGEGAIADPRFKRSELPPVLTVLIDQLLAVNPEDRPSTAAAVAAALTPFSAGADLGALAKAYLHADAKRS